jgi:hypothetical protein
MESSVPRRGHGLFDTAGPIGRVSHGLRCVVTAPAGHGAPLRSRQLSARIISFFINGFARIQQLIPLSGGIYPAFAPEFKPNKENQNQQNSRR